MVCMCAGCNVYQPWSAILIGIFAGVGFLFTHFLMLKLKIDDPLDAVAVHGASGKEKNPHINILKIYLN